MVVATKVDYKRLQHPALVFLLLGFTTLLLILFFLDRSRRTAGFMSVRFRCSLRNWLSRTHSVSRWFLENKITPWTTGATH